MSSKKIDQLIEDINDIYRKARAESMGVKTRQFSDGVKAHARAILARQTGTGYNTVDLLLDEIPELIDRNDAALLITQLPEQW